MRAASPRSTRIVAAFAGAVAGAAASLVFLSAIGVLIVSVEPDLGLAVLFAFGSAVLLVATNGAVFGGLAGWHLTGTRPPGAATTLSWAVVGLCVVAAGIVAYEILVVERREAEAHRAATERPYAGAEESLRTRPDPDFRWRGLAMAARYRECLLLAQSRADAIGEWKGEWHSLPVRVAETSGCPGVRAAEHTRVTTHSWRLVLSQDESRVPQSVQVLYEARSPAFVLHVERSGRSYMLDPAGAWHVTDERRRAGPDDPPPPACEVDPTLECDGR